MQREVTTLIHVPMISKRKKDAFWYFDKHIATVMCGDVQLEIVSQGDILVSFRPYGNQFANGKAVAEATRLHLGDRMLADINARDGFSQCNWLAVNRVDGKGSTELGSYPYYDQAIEEAKKYASKLARKSKVLA